MTGRDPPERRRHLLERQPELAQVDQLVRLAPDRVGQHPRAEVDAALAERTVAVVDQHHRGRGGHGCPSVTAGAADCTFTGGGGAGAGCTGAGGAEELCSRNLSSSTGNGNTRVEFLSDATWTIVSRSRNC